MFGGGPQFPPTGGFALKSAAGPHFPADSFLLLWRLPTSALKGPWRNPRRRYGAPAPLLRRRGAPAPSPPARPIRGAPATAVGGKGQRCPAL